MTDKQLKDRNTELTKEVMDWHDSELPKTEQVSVFFLRLSAKYKMSERNIYQILEDNAVTILSHKDHEKLKRIFRLKREIAQKEKSNKDVADLLDQVRIEYEGIKVEHLGSVGETKIIIIRPDTNKEEKIGDKTFTFSRPVLI